MKYLTVYSNNLFARNSVDYLSKTEDPNTMINFDNSLHVSVRVNFVLTIVTDIEPETLLF